jgi:hypothetical protein
LELREQVRGDLLGLAFAVDLQIREFPHSGLLSGASTVDVPANAVSALARLEALGEHAV